MSKAANTYRAARREQARCDQIKFPWPGIEAKVIEAPPVRPNKRDRSPEADAQRARHITMDFTDGVAGLIRMLINHEPPTVHGKKPKRGWAAKRRAAPFAPYLDPAKMGKARARHIHPRHKRRLMAPLPIAAE